MWKCISSNQKAWALCTLSLSLSFFLFPSGFMYDLSLHLYLLLILFVSSLFLLHRSFAFRIVHCVVLTTCSLLCWIETMQQQLFGIHAKKWSKQIDTSKCNILKCRAVGAPQFMVTIANTGNHPLRVILFVAHTFDSHFNSGVTSRHPLHNSIQFSNDTTERFN